MPDETRTLKAKEFEQRQKEIDVKYEKEGLTDEVLELQVQLNQERNRLNISDPTKRIYENYVQ